MSRLRRIYIVTFINRGLSNIGAIKKSLKHIPRVGSVQTIFIATVVGKGSFKSCGIAE